MQNKLSIYSLLALILLALNGCASNSTPDYAEIAKDSEAENSDPQTLYDRTAALFDRPENLGLELYSPSYYRQAVEALQDAEVALQGLHQSPISPVSALVAARKLLEKAQANREVAERNLRDLIKHRNLLVELNAAQWQARDWRKVSEEISDLMRLVEKGEVKAALSQEPKVREDMYSLEIDTLLASALQSARASLKQAEEADADNYAPMLLKSAEVLIDDTEIYIRSNFRDRKGISEQAEQARLEAVRAYKTTLDAKRLLSFDEQEMEEYLRNLKTEFSSIALLLDEQPLLPSTIDESLDTLSTLVKDAKTALDEKESDAPDSSATEETLFEPEEEGDIEVLQVLDSLYVEDEADKEGLSEQEQSFDTIEYIE